MFETSIFCDKCGCGFSFPNVEPKWFMTKIARQKDGLLGKGIYALVAIIRTEGKVKRMSSLKITQCKGEGQGSCKRCSDNGKWNRIWMRFLYKIEGYDGCYCSDCVKEIMESEQNETD